MITLWEHEVTLFDLPSVLSLSSPMREQVIAGLAGQPGALCAAMVGRFNLRVGPNPTPVPHALVYLEWQDNRWWTAWQPLDAERRFFVEPKLQGRGIEERFCRIRLTLTPSGRESGWVH